MTVWDAALLCIPVIVFLYFSYLSYSAQISAPYMRKDVITEMINFPLRATGPQCLERLKIPHQSRMSWAYIFCLCCCILNVKPEWQSYAYRQSQLFYGFLSLYSFSGNFHLHNCKNAFHMFVIRTINFGLFNSEVQTIVGHPSANSSHNLV